MDPVPSSDKTAARVNAGRDFIRFSHCAVTIIPSLRCFISRDFINPSSPFRSSIRFTG